MKKMLSMFLALVMIFGVFAVCASPISAVSGKGTKSSPYIIETYSELGTYLSKSGTAYLKIGKNLSTESASTINVNGTKYLDLNGCQVKNVLKTDSRREYMFSVSGNLTINDSSAKTTSTSGKGSITFDNRIWTPDSNEIEIAKFVLQRHTFSVAKDGVLTLNQGTIETGSSKKVWIYDGRAIGNPSKLYNGNAYVQINGSAVYVKADGKFIMNGGTLFGRGLDQIDVNTAKAKKAAVIHADNGIKGIEINGGRVVGKGGADILSTSGAPVIIRAGSFETEKLDAAWLARLPYTIAGVKNCYRNACIGTGYGNLNIPSDAFQEGMKNKSINVLLSGKDYISKNGDWKLKSSVALKTSNLTVYPIDRTYSNFSTLTGELFNTLNYTYGTDYDLGITGSLYFPNDYEPSDSTLQINVVENGKIIKTNYLKGANKVNIDNIYDFSVGHTYQVSGYLTQRWNTNDYVVVSTINPINITVKEQKVRKIDLNYNASNVVDGKLKSGTTIDALKLSSKTNGVSANVLQVIIFKPGQGFPTNEAIKDNNKYRITLKISADYGYAINSDTTVTAFGQTVKLRGSDGKVGYADFDIESNCLHKTTKIVSNGVANHSKKCAVCDYEISTSLHSMANPVTNADKTTYTCKDCGYKQTTTNGREAISSVVFVADEAVQGGKIPSLSIMFPDYWGLRYGITYKWYKGEGSSKKEVNVGSTFEDSVYTLEVTGTIKNTSKYYFTGTAYCGGMFYQNGTTTRSESKIVTTIKVEPLKRGTGSLTFPNNPAIGSYLYDVAKQIKLTAKANDGSKVSQDFVLWIYEAEQGKNEIPYEVKYNSTTNTWSSKADDYNYFQDISKVKIRPDVTYKINLIGPSGIAFDNVKIIGGEGCETKFVDAIFTKGLNGECYFTVSSKITEINLSDPGNEVGKIFVGVPTPTSPKCYLADSKVEELGYNQTIFCDKETVMTVTLRPVNGCYFAGKEDLSVGIDKNNIEVLLAAPGEVVIKYTIKPTGHYITESKTVAPTCTAEGITTGVCKNCGETVTIGTMEALGHSYDSILNPATTTENGLSMKKCSICGNEISKKTIYMASSVKLSKTKLTYNGSSQKPTVIVTDSKGAELKPDVDYKVSYSSSTSKSTGRYTVTVTFIGNYSGEKVLSYVIIPKAPTGLQATSESAKKVQLTYEKATGASGYEIIMREGKSGKYVNITATKKLAYTKKSLTSGTKYYFKVRAYKTVGEEKIYGSYSTAVVVKVK